MSRDHELEYYLTGSSELSRIYHAGTRELPPGDLDNTIISLAGQNIVDAKISSSISLAWTLPVSLAAAVVLGAVLVLYIQASRELDTPPLQRVVETAPGPPIATDETTSLARLPGEDREPAQLPPSSGQIELSSLRETTIARITGAAPDVGGNVDQAPLESPELTTRLALPEPEWTVALMENPAAWLDYIEVLALKNRVDEARTHLRAFRSRYAQIALPETLLEWAPSEPTAD